MGRSAKKSGRGVMTMWEGGPMDGSLCEVPHLSESWTIEAGSGDAAKHLSKMHKYTLTDRKSKGGEPIYHYAGVAGK